MAQQPIQPDQSPGAIERTEQQTIEEITAAIALLARADRAINRVSIVICHWSWRVETAVQHAARQAGIWIAVEESEAGEPATIVIQRASQAADCRPRSDAAVSAELPLSPRIDDQGVPHRSAGKDLAAG